MSAHPRVFAPGGQRLNTGLSEQSSADARDLKGYPRHGALL